MKYDEINSRNDLADFLGIQRKHLTYILYVRKVENCYRSFKIPKKNGSKRLISAPNESLGLIQKRLADALSKQLSKARNAKTNTSHAFEKGKSIVTNARVHRNKRFVLNVDLKDFFDSFNFGRVQGFFIKNHYFRVPKDVATIIAQLTCYNGVLPQGSPSSPIITNLICQILDYRLLRIAKKYKSDYTRYADDLTFSSNYLEFPDFLDTLLEELDSEIIRAGFLINKEKTRLQFRDSRQVVTGVTVNKKLNTRLEYRKNTRAMAHSLFTKEEFVIEGIKGTIGQLEGRFAFIDQLDRHGITYAKRLDEDRKTAKRMGGSNDKKVLSMREKEYQRFLFYKYFYGHTTPLILTEGKTDVIHMRAALKNLHEEYPDLITRKSDGTFEFKVTFLRRSDRLAYFFDLVEGADSMSSLYYYFVDKNPGRSKMTNYWKYFNSMCPNPSKHPVMLFFDNELTNKKPLQKFIGKVDSPEEKKENLKSKLYCEVLEDGNLYLLTVPLIKEKSECEIEDLYKDELIEMSIDGKTFSKEPSADRDRYFGKLAFSKVVSKKYEEVDFSNFKPIFDSIIKVIKSYEETVRKNKS